MDINSIRSLKPGDPVEFVAGMGGLQPNIAGLQKGLKVPATVVHVGGYTGYPAVKIFFETGEMLWVDPTSLQPSQQSLNDKTNKVLEALTQCELTKGLRNLISVAESLLKMLEQERDRRFREKRGFPQVGRSTSKAKAKTCLVKPDKASVVNIEFDMSDEPSSRIRKTTKKSKKASKKSSKKAGK